MSRIVFLSYANKDLNPRLVDFFTDLCEEIAEGTEYTTDDPRISFRDKPGLPLMENWRNNIVEALQTSDVMLCVTSPKYLASQFCAREFYLFDQRRRQASGGAVPPVILPVIWNPTNSPLPAEMSEVQQLPKDVSEAYRTRGLREISNLEGRDSRIYKTCVTAFARAILAASRAYGKKIDRLQNVPEFENVPNVFAGVRWDDEVVRNGAFVEGPEVANFIFAAPSKDERNLPEGRYGPDSSQWCPFFPKETETVRDHVTSALKKQFKFREIPVDDNLESELRQSKLRQNLSIVIGEPSALTLDRFKATRAIEDIWWDGCAVFAAFHESVGAVDQQEAEFRKAFPRLAQSDSARVGRPRSPAELRNALDAALFEMKRNITQPMVDAKEKKDPPPTDITGSAAARP